MHSTDWFPNKTAEFSDFYEKWALCKKRKAFVYREKMARTSQVMSKEAKEKAQVGHYAFFLEYSWWCWDGQGKKLIFDHTAISDKTEK